MLYIDMNEEHLSKSISIPLAVYVE